MTRETKIGLVVGLAFIIVIGVLVSDHLSSVTRPPQARFEASGGVERSTTSPGGSVRQGSDREIRLNDPIAPTGRLGGNVTSPVIPRSGNPGGGGTTPIIPTPRDPNDVIRPITDPRTTDDTTQAEPPPVRPGIDPEIVLPPGTALYEAKAGDTVSKLAAKFMGANTNANREKLISLNPELKANPNKITVGDVFIVPDPNARRVVRGREPLPLVPLVAPERTDIRGIPLTPREDTATIAYTTRPGDTLWKIARDQCGSQSKQTVEQIKTLNQDVLKGKEMLHPNLKLKIPARAVATRA